MPKDVTKIGDISVSAYSATFAARGLTAHAEQWSNGQVAVDVVKTTGGQLKAVGVGSNLLDAINHAASCVGIPPFTS